MTEDEIIAAANKILKRRLNEDRLEAFKQRETITIRWDVPFGKLAKGYDGIEVSRDVVQKIVEDYFKPLIKKEPT